MLWFKLTANYRPPLHITPEEINDHHNNFVLESKLQTVRDGLICTGLLNANTVSFCELYNVVRYFRFSIHLFLLVSKILHYKQNVLR
jgi:hypothetical protein